MNIVLELTEQHKRGTFPTLRRADVVAAGEDLATPAGISRRFLDKAAEIRRDARLTPTGQRDALREAGRAAWAEAEAWLTAKRAGLDAHEERILAEMRQAVLRPKASDLADRIEAALLRAEVRRGAAGLNPSELELLYRAGDSTVRAALEELPRIEAHGNGAVSVRPYVSEALRDEVLLDAGEKARPDLADTLHDVRLIRSVFATVTGALRQQISRESPNALTAAIAIL
jgi:hypothetical protein